MIIKDISIYPVCYEMLNVLESSTILHKNRDSWIIKITDIDGYIGYGEASPLPDFNDETFEESGYALEGFKLAFKGINDNMALDELMILIQAHTLNSPSANFAIDTAINDILAQQKNCSLNKYLNFQALSEININGIYGLTNLDNYNTIKIKCGFRNLYDEIEILKKLSDKYNSSVNFIIDLNQAYDLPKAIRFFKEIEQFNIKYIEQPINKSNFEDLIELRFHTDINIALDESINDFDSINRMIDINCGDIFIIKPQSIGGFSTIKKAVDLINGANKIPVITSSLEGLIGRLSTMHLCSANLISSPCGLAMESIYANETIVFPKIDKGILSIPNQVGLGYQKD